MISKAYFRTSPARVLLAGLALLIIGGGPALGAQGEKAPVDYIELLGFVDKPSARFLIDQVHRAESSGSAALIVRIDSPGGLEAPVKQLVDTIRAAKVPVVVWIGPSGAQGGSVAAFIAAAAKVTAIAPKATLGPVLPVDLAAAAAPASSAGEQRELFRKLVSGKPAGRGDFAYHDEIESRAISGIDARRLGLVEETASNLPRLLRELDSRRVNVAGEQMVLPSQPFTIRFHKMGFVPRLLHSALRPSVAYLLVILGIFGFIFELYHPGIGAAAVAGALSLGFGLYSMTVLPTNWPVAMLLMASLGLFLIELHRCRLGAFSLAGSAAFFAGSLMLFSGPREVFGLPWWVIAGGVAMIALFYFFIMPAAFRSQMTPAAEVRPLLGLPGVAHTDLSPQGKVSAGGRIWEARTFGAAIPEAANVVVKGASGTVLIVEQAKTSDSAEA